MTSNRANRPRAQASQPPAGGVTNIYFPAEPVHRALRRLIQGDVDLTALAEVLRIDRSTLYRLLSRDRLRYDAADRIATALGRHPWELWPEWFPEVRPQADR